jgi:hypothetical protein
MSVKERRAHIAPIAVGAAIQIPTRRQMVWSEARDLCASSLSQDLGSDNSLYEIPSCVKYLEHFFTVLTKFILIGLLYTG